MKNFDTRLKTNDADKNDIGIDAAVAVPFMPAHQGKGICCCGRNAFGNKSWVKPGIEPIY